MPLNEIAAALNAAKPDEIAVMSAYDLKALSDACFRVRMLVEAELDEMGMRAVG